MFAAGHHLLLSFLRPSIAFTMDFNVGDIPSSIWTEEEAPEVDEEEEDTFLCQVCGKRDTLECSTCDLYLCRGCMDEHTCNIDVPE